MAELLRTVEAEAQCSKYRRQPSGTEPQELPCHASTSSPYRCHCPEEAERQAEVKGGRTRKIEAQDCYLKNQAADRNRKYTSRFFVCNSRTMAECHCISETKQRQWQLNGFTIGYLPSCGVDTERMLSRLRSVLVGFRPGLPLKRRSVRVVNFCCVSLLVMAPYLFVYDLELRLILLVDLDDSERHDYEHLGLLKSLARQQHPFRPFPSWLFVTFSTLPINL